MKLKDAIELYKQEDGAYSNSYEWYRKCAQGRENISISGTDVPAYKKKGVWCIDDGDFTKAIENHRTMIRRRKQVTDDYNRGVINGKDGDTVHTDFGGYNIHGAFRFVWSNYENAHMKSSGEWYCNRCNTPAETEHNKPECHLCSDWNGCGRDCTLSKVYCAKCGKSIDV